MASVSIPPLLRISALIAEQAFMLSFLRFPISDFRFPISGQHRTFVGSSAESALVKHYLRTCRNDSIRGVVGGHLHSPPEPRCGQIPVNALWSTRSAHRLPRSAELFHPTALFTDI